MCFFLEVYASTYGTIPDHCIAYALRDPKDVHLRNDCDHNHDDSCSQCELLKAALMGIRDAISEAIYRKTSEMIFRIHSLSLCKQ